MVRPSCTRVGSGSAPARTRARDEGGASHTQPEGLACHGSGAGPGGPSQNTSSTSPRWVASGVGPPPGCPAARPATQPAGSRGDAVGCIGLAAARRRCATARNAATPTSRVRQERLRVGGGRGDGPDHERRRGPDRRRCRSRPRARPARPGWWARPRAGAVLGSRSMCHSPWLTTWAPRGDAGATPRWAARARRRRRRGCAR